MRNLKKILALVLALVMSLSLVTIANASDFTDADDITYEEAADVMSTIGVIEGYEDGSFDPDGTLVREEAAKLVTFMLLGDNANNLGIERSSFNDGAMTRWSAPAIEYCVSLGIIDGAGDGNFYPRGQLTAVAFAKVLLTALGYDADTEGLVGATWSVNTAALAMEVGLDNGIEDLSWNAALTREEAAQMALNAIQAPLVAYEGGVTVVVGDTPVSFGSGDAYYITTTLAREQRISDVQLSNSNDYTVEFGESYMPRLSLKGTRDDFMRPAHVWDYKGVEIGTYTDEADLTYTTKVTSNDIYDDLGLTGSVVADVYEDGVQIADFTVKNNDINTKIGANGVLTQVFKDGHVDGPVGAGVALDGAVIAQSAQQHLHERVAAQSAGGTEGAISIAADDALLRAVGDVARKGVGHGNILEGSGASAESGGSGGAQDQVADDLGGRTAGQDIIGPEVAAGITVDNAQSRDHVYSFFVGDAAVVREVLGAGADGDQRHGHHQSKHQRKELLHSDFSSF